MKNEKIKKPVREFYAKIATQGGPCHTPVKSQCGGCGSAQDVHGKMVGVGYTDKELKGAPERSNLGLGIGNPAALASLRKGEIVLDLGSGPGLDCFLAAKKVGKSGRVIGVDMTPEMIDRARENAEKGKYKNVEFRLGEIENLPAADNSVDVIISNCVVNLAPDKRKVFKEAFRVLKPGGRLMIMDAVLKKKLPSFIKNSIEAYAGCISGAVQKDEYIRIMKAAGFQQVRIIGEISSPIKCECMANDPALEAISENLKIPIEKAKEVADSVVSMKVYGVKPVETNPIY
jgi:SAM-dependent methyltransferase